MSRSRKSGSQCDSADSAVSGSEKQWPPPGTITAAVTLAGVTFFAWKMYRQRRMSARQKRLIYSLAHVGVQIPLPATHDHTLSAIYTRGRKYPKVYSIGGHNSPSDYLEVWTLDPAFERWREVLPAVHANSRARVFGRRSCHASAGIGNDIYVIGGYTNKTTNDVLLLSTRELRWSTPFFSGGLLQPRSSHSATVVNKKIYVFGGYGEALAFNDVHVLNTDTNTWTRPFVIGCPPSPRCAHSAVLLNGGDRILIFGGYSSTAERDLWFLEIDTPFVREQRERHGKETVAWSKGYAGQSVRPVVICGPSGVGKSTLIRKLLYDFPDQLGLSVSHTTRSPRVSERDGVHYHFTKRGLMENAVREGKFLESANVHGNLYGTSIDAVEAISDSGKRCILDIDIQGAASVKKSPLKALFIFIYPPNLKELELRLRGRGTETEEQIQMRIQNAKVEMSQGHDHTLFDHFVINDKLDNAYNHLKRILKLNSDLLEKQEMHPCARSGHSSSMIGLDVLVFGGVTSGGTPVNDMWVLDTAGLMGGAPAMTRGLTWFRPQPESSFLKSLLHSPPTLAARYNHAAIELSSEEVLLTGGFDGEGALNDSIIVKIDPRP